METKNQLIVKHCVLLSKKIAKLQENKRSLYDIFLIDDTELKSQATKLSNCIDCLILQKQQNILNLFKKLEKYDESKHLQISYISSKDILDGFVDISLNDKEYYILNLKTSEIELVTENPEDKMETA